MCIRDRLYADEAQADKQLRPDVLVLIGSVRMKHDSMYMFCYSALIFEKIDVYKRQDLSLAVRWAYILSNIWVSSWPVAIIIAFLQDH